MQYFQTLIEQVSYLNICTVKKAIIYSVLIPFFQAGDIMIITTEFEATNHYQYNVMIGSAIILGDEEGSVEGDIIDPANAFNISPSMHHGVVTKARSYQTQKDVQNKYVNVVAWAASKNAKASHQLKIEQNYGHLDILIAREDK